MVLGGVVVPSFAHADILLDGFCLLCVCFLCHSVVILYLIVASLTPPTISSIMLGKISSSLLLLSTQLQYTEGRLTSGLDYPNKQLEEDNVLRKDSFCDTPIAKQKVEFPESLIGRAHVDFDMFSGYVNYLSHFIFCSRSLH